MSDDPRLRWLLKRYAARRPADAPWHDRVMELQDADAPTLTRLHGVLLANGWLDVRVDPDTFAQPGGPRRCYAISAEGRRALQAQPT